MSGDYADLRALADRGPWNRCVESYSGCWLWTGPLRRDGYGVVQVAGKKWATHRLAYTLAVGPIPEGMYVCHRCDVRACIRPEHLWVGSHSDNIRDAVNKGRHYGDTSAASIAAALSQRQKTACPQGHPYSDENTYTHRGKRHCRTCRRSRSCEYQARRRAAS